MFTAYILRLGSTFEMAKHLQKIGAAMDYTEENLKKEPESANECSFELEDWLEINNFKIDTFFDSSPEIPEIVLYTKQKKKIVEMENAFQKLFPEKDIPARDYRKYLLNLDEDTIEEMDG